MAIAAVPDYLGTDFSTASPGLRFGMYFSGWTNDWKKAIPDQKKNEQPFLKLACNLTDNDKATMKQLLQRQQACFKAVADDASGLCLSAESTSPFATGLGNEHPTDNGFAFLNPYGLPYLPGSGVKGVLRQAARELAEGQWGDTKGWDHDHIVALFGNEDSDHAQRGALVFWDVIPQLKGDALTVEIMTPHQGAYYRGEQTPHESGLPVPITFLAVPHGSGFMFHVQCNQSLLQHTAPHLQQNWKQLLQAAFEHAFNWLGFGAKTAVGYGAMVDKDQIAKAKEQLRQEKLREAGIAVGAAVWESAQIVSCNPGAGEIQIKSADGKLVSGKFYSQLSDAAKKRLKNKKTVTVNVEVEEKGNLITIAAITEVGQ